MCLNVLGLILAALVVAGSASAEPPAPNWMPGFPMLAGPQVIMMWQPVPGAVKYKVYMNGKPVADTPAMQHMLAAPEQSGEYKVEISAVDAAGKEGPKSRASAFKIVKVSPPKNATPLVSGKNVLLRWDAVEGAVVYNVYKRGKGEKEFKLLHSSQDTRFSDTTGEIGKEYEYAFSAKDVSGKESDRSESLAVYLAAAVAAKKEKEYAINPIPTVRQQTIEMNNYPIDVKVHGNAAIVSWNALSYFPDITAGAGEVLLNGKGGFNGVTLSRDGKVVYAANSGEKKVYAIDPVGNAVLGTYTIPQPAPGELEFEGASGKTDRRNPSSPWDVAVDSEGNLYVTDNANFRIVKLSKDGKYLGTVGYAKEKMEWGVTMVSYLSIDKYDRKFATGTSSIVVFSKDDKRIGEIGRPGQEFGTFSKPRAAVMDGKDRLFVSDTQANNIQVFVENKTEGVWEPTFLLTNETKDGNPDWAMPAGFDIFPGDDALLVPEALAKRLGIFKVKK